jgi:hypothetical protein
MYDIAVRKLALRMVADLGVLPKQPLYLRTTVVLMCKHTCCNIVLMCKDNCCNIVQCQHISQYLIAIQ